MFVQRYKEILIQKEKSEKLVRIATWMPQQKDACPDHHDINLTDVRFAFHLLALVMLCLTDCTDYTECYASLALSSRTRMGLISLMDADAWFLSTADSAD